MKKIIIKTWLVLFFVTLIPIEVFDSPFLSFPTTRAEEITVETKDLVFTEKDGGSYEYVSPTITTVFPFEVVTSRWQGDEDVNFYFRVQSSSQWSAWQVIEPNWDISTGDVTEGEFLFTNKATTLQYKVAVSGNPNDHLQRFQIIYLHSPIGGTQLANAAFSISPRSAWGADENLRYKDEWQKARDEYCRKASWACVPLSDKAQEELRLKKEELVKNFPEEMKIVQTITQENGHDLQWPLEYTSKVRKIILHHTGDDFTNNDNVNSGENENTNSDTLTAVDYQSRIRSIYYYHAVVRGWGDIGYNYIVDPLGNMYEGRAGGERVLGAHVAWNNEGSLGIALMGNYENIDLGGASLNGMVNALSLIAKKYNLDPQGFSSFRGKELPNIISHRDLAATACPGKNFYDKIPQLRVMVGAKLRSGDTISVPIVGEVNDANDDYSAQYYSTDIMDVAVPPTGAKTVRFRFKNTGRITWQAGTYLSGCCSFDSTLDVPNRLMDDQNVVLSSMESPSVAPGQIGDFLVTFLSGYIERVNIVTLAPVINGERKVQSVLIPVTVETPNYGYEFISSRYPKSRLFYTELTEAEVTLKNTGNITWINKGENAIVLKPDQTRWRKTEFHPEDATILATMKEEKVLPGQIGHFVFHLTAPSVSRLYEEHFTPYIKQVGYFKDKGMYFRMVVVDPSTSLEYKFNQSDSQTYAFLPGERRTISVVIQNTDDRRWNNLQMNTVDLLSWGDGGNQISSSVSFDKNTVEKNDTVRMFFTVTASNTYGRHTFSLLPRVGGKNLFNRRIEVTFHITVPTMKAQIVGLSIDPTAHVYERGKVSLFVENTGNTIWNRGDINLGKFYDRENPSVFYDYTWLGALRPTSLLENEVHPGEVGTFEFYIMPKKEGILDEYFKLGVQGYGWVDMNPVLVRITVVKDGALNSPPTSAGGDSSLSFLYKEDIKVKLGFTPSPSDQKVVYRINTSSTLSSDAQSVLVGQDEDIVLTVHQGVLEARTTQQIITGSEIRLIPSTTDSIITVTNWDRYPSWDTTHLYNDNRFRGRMTTIIENNTPVLVNELSLEYYIQGVAEVPESDHHEKKKVMSILARTYALFYMDTQNRKFPGKIYDASDDPNVFQKYLGYGFELRSPDWLRSVQETMGMVVTYQGKLIKTPYFNQSDGRTRSAEEVWGWKDTPYLVSVLDPLCPEKILKGHGVGLSGCGAQEAAKLGHSYDTIIKYYYQDVDLTTIK